MKAPIQIVSSFATKVLLVRKSQAAKQVVESPVDFPDAANSEIKLQTEEAPAKD
jgi:hypothetical protein